MEITSDPASQASTEFIHSSDTVSDYEKLIRAALNSKPVVLLSKLKLVQVRSHGEHNNVTEQITPMCIKQEPVDIIAHIQGYGAQQDSIQTDMSLIDLKPTDVEIAVSSENYSGELLPSTSQNKDYLIHKQAYSVDATGTSATGHCQYLTTPDNNLKDLTRRIKTHSGEKPYKCDQCTFQTDIDGIFRLHMRAHVGQQRLYMRDQGEFRTVWNSGIKLNLSTHVEEKPYKCDQCDYQTSFRYGLKQHLRAHTVEQPLKCEHCDYRSSQQSKFDSHIRRHTKPYKCDQCAYQASNKGSLILRTRTHTGEKPYKCDQCDYKAARSKSLRRHMRTHTEEKPYKCDQCDYRTKWNNCLKRHMVIHTGEKPYTCDHCGYQTGHFSSLKRHMKTHTD